MHEQAAERSNDATRWLARTAVLVIACDRAAYLDRALASILRHKGGRPYPIIVSQDGTHPGVAEVVRAHAGLIHLQHIAPPFAGGRPPRGWDAYHCIARHYGWALGRVFDGLGFDRVIILEDDLEIAPDFFDYMEAGGRLIDRDPTLWTVSAWNDNGQARLVRDAAALYRSDFFPGLGWLMTRALWRELGPKWPATYWDDWMRLPEQRKGRASIRPEVSRTYTFGAEGVSQGQFYEQHLRAMKLNDEPVDFGGMDLGYLIKDAYDRQLVALVQGARWVSPEEVLAARGSDPVRVEYIDDRSFAGAAKRFGLMNDIRSGTARTAYLGVVAFRYEGRQVYLAPACFPDPPRGGEFEADRWHRMFRAARWRLASLPRAAWRRLREPMVGRRERP